MEESIALARTAEESITTQAVVRQPAVGWYRRILRSRKATYWLHHRAFLRIDGILCPADRPIRAHAHGGKAS
jgi:hypothetical protein